MDLWYTISIRFYLSTLQDSLTAGYSTMAYSAQPASVAPAGEAWRSYSDRNSLFSGDGSHAQSAGNMAQYCPGSEPCCQAPT